MKFANQKLSQHNYVENETEYSYLKTWKLFSTTNFRQAAKPHKYAKKNLHWN